MDTSEWLFDKFGGGFASAAGSSAFSSFMSAIGLDGGAAARAEAEYFNAVMDRLKAIGAQLDQLSAKMSAGFATLNQGLTEIKETIDDAKLQASLLQMVEPVSLINETFATYADAVAGLTNTDGALQRAAIGDLHTVLSTRSAVDVAAAMLSIHAIAVGSSELTGLIDYQPNLMKQAIRDWGAAPANYVTQQGWPNFPDCGQIVRQAEAVMTPVLRDKVLPAFSALLLAQTRGLALLTTAWKGGPQAPQLATHAANIQSQIDRMRGLFAKEAMAWAAGTVTAVLADHGPAVPWSDVAGRNVMFQLPDALHDQGRYEAAKPYRYVYMIPAEVPHSVRHGPFTQTPTPGVLTGGADPSQFYSMSAIKAAAPYAIDALYGIGHYWLDTVPRYTAAVQAATAAFFKDAPSAATAAGTARKAV